MNWFNYNDVRFTRIKWSVFFFFSFGSSDIFLISYSFYYIVDFSIIFKQKWVFQYVTSLPFVTVCSGCMQRLSMYFSCLSVFQRAKCSTFYEMFRCVVSFSSLFRVVIRRLVVWWIYRKTKFVWWMIEIEHTLKRKLNEFAGKSML